MRQYGSHNGRVDNLVGQRQEASGPDAAFALRNICDEGGGRPPRAFIQTGRQHIYPLVATSGEEYDGREDERSELARHVAATVVDDVRRHPDQLMARPGLSVKATNEQSAINEALGNCVKSDSDCHVIAIGPFAVGPN